MTGIKNNSCRIQLPQHWKKQPFREDVMPKTTDPRTLQTKAQIRKTLLELLQKAPFSKLTVKELCACTTGICLPWWRSWWSWSLQKTPAHSHMSAA